jgi:hypothetical protein
MSLVKIAKAIAEYSVVQFVRKSYVGDITILIFKAKITNEEREPQDALLLNLEP